MQDVLEQILVKGKLSATLINSSVLVNMVLHVYFDQANHKNKSSGLIESVYGLFDCDHRD